MSQLSYRWMMFVDGENLSTRFKEIARATGRQISPGPNSREGVFLWLPTQTAESRDGLGGPKLYLAAHSIRSFYYTTVRGDDIALLEVREALRNLGFDPNVFKKKDGKSKGVDITMAVDMLHHAAQGSYDACILIAGDGDYVPLVKAVQRYGKAVGVSFFDHAAGGLSLELKLSADNFHDITQLFLDQCTNPPSTA